MKNPNAKNRKLEQCGRKKDKRKFDIVNIFNKNQIYVSHFSKWYIIISVYGNMTQKHHDLDTYITQKLTKHENLLYHLIFMCIQNFL